MVTPTKEQQVMLDLVSAVAEYAGLAGQLRLENYTTHHNVEVGTPLEGAKDTVEVSAQPLGLNPRWVMDNIDDALDAAFAASVE